MFTEWINEKYNEWRGKESGQAVSRAAYARLIGVSLSTLNSWLDLGRIPTDDKSIRALADYFGEEIFDVLEIGEASYGLDLVPDPYRSAVLKVIHTLVSRRVTPSTDEAKQIAHEILELEIKKRNK